MRLAKFEEKNIFCIEGEWNPNLKDKTSIRSALDFLLHCSKIEYIHKNCSTEDQFQKYINTSLQLTYKKHSILYIAFHGTRGSIDLSKKDKLNIGKIVEFIDGKATDKIVHFGCCKTLNVSDDNLRKFLENTGALAISGYTKNINFIQSTFLDMLYFNHCQEFKKISAIENKMNRYYGELIKELGFMIKYL